MIAPRRILYTPNRVSFLRSTSFSWRPTRNSAIGVCQFGVSSQHTGRTFGTGCTWSGRSWLPVASTVQSARVVERRRLWKKRLRRAIIPQREPEDGYYIHQIGPTFFSLQVSHDAPGAILRFNRLDTRFLRAYRARLLSPTVRAYSEFRSVERLVASYDNRSVFKGYN